jgi:hypothetical protein
MHRNFVRAIAFVIPLWLVPVTLRPVCAQDTPEELSATLMSNRGLLGMGSMVDARSTARPHARAVTSYEFERSRVDSPTTERTFERHLASVVAGFSALGVLDTGIRWVPFERLEVDDETVGAQPIRRRDQGTGDLSLAAKGSWTFDKTLSVGAYVFGHMAIARRALDRTNDFEVGPVVTLAVLDQRLAFHLNLVYANLNAGNNVLRLRAGEHAFRWRVGVSGVPFAIDDAVIRPYLYVDGIELAGSRGSDVRVGIGVQSLFFGHLVVAVGGEYKVHDGDLPPGARDHGTGGVGLGVGFAWLF